MYCERLLRPVGGVWEGPGVSQTGFPKNWLGFAGMAPGVPKKRLILLWFKSFGEEGEIADFSEMNLSGLDLSKSNLRKANFENADLSSVDFTGSILREANLHGANLTEANLTAANLER